MSASTPWGKADYSQRLVRGVTFYGTSRHGGYCVSRTLVERFPDCLAPKIRTARGGWYEEDCEWARAALALDWLGVPAHNDKTIESAKLTVQKWFPEDWAKYQAMRGVA